MTNAVKILILEHDPTDIELLQYELKKGGIVYTPHVVQTEEDYIQALHNFDPDIILSDFSLPSYNGVLAFEEKQRICKQVPFIFVSGTVGEERTIELIKDGVTDYVLKDKMFTLSTKVSRALKEARERQDKQKAERKLINSEKYLRSIINNNADGIALMSDDMAITYISPNCKKILGFTPEELIGPFRMDLIHPDDRQLLAAIYNEATRNPQSKKLLQYRIKKKDGAYIWTEANYSNHLQDADINAVILNYRDITEKKLIEDQIRQLNTELEERVASRTAELVDANQQLEAFSYSVSHDLRSPIRSIYGFAQILERKYKNTLDEEGLELLSVIRTSTAKMQQLVEDLLAFSRLGKKNISRSLIHKQSLVQNIWNTINDGSETVPHLILKPLPDACGDEPLLTQVWVNLLSNAVKYSSKSDNPIVEVGAEDIGDEIVYYVKDNGAGFDMRYADKLFTVFQRLHEASEFEGTGVGLAIVKRIIEKHNGRVWAEGKINKGAAFYFALPKMPQHHLITKQTQLA